MPKEYNDDDQRMIRLQEGDHTAFDEIVAAWQSPLYGYFFRRIRDAQRAEDLVQETLLRLYRKGWDYVPTGCFRGWLFRIAHNLLIDSVRRRSHDALVRRISVTASCDGEEVDLLSLMPADLVTAEVRVAQGEVVEVVQELLTGLPEEQRQTFMLHHFESLTLPEVAEAMNTTLPTAKSRLRLAKEKLRYHLTCRGLAEEPVSEKN